ncbi:hypothetical protein BJ878DRAFT_475910 [Calycina marina]|uniref:Uncharacterized protein n=1 Tax=Calycina marina TaxID=1763456 RepID=A0A9P8CJQ4_9HELO|nr:hypothetical protein BJ878DRAFT_475910 [Calycina marina]
MLVDDTALGVDVTYTELDIRHTALPLTDAQLQQQATGYPNTVGACLAMEGLFVVQGEALLWNSDFSTKSCYTSLVALLGELVASTSDFYDDSVDWCCYSEI